MKYKAIASTFAGLGDLENTVETMLKEGWELHSGIVCGNGIYCQVMVKNVESNNSCSFHERANICAFFGDVECNTTPCCDQRKVP